MEAITTAVSTVTTLVGDVFDMITDSPVLSVFLAFGLVSGAIGVFRRLKSSAK